VVNYIAGGIIRLQNIHQINSEEEIMTVTEMTGKFKTANGSMAVRSLDEVVSGGSAEDFVQDGTIAKIIEASKTGYYDERFGKNAVVVIMEACKLKEDGTVEGTGEAVQVSLSMFDRTAAPYKKEADGTIARDKGKETQRADGSAVADWKKAQNAKAFMEANQGKAIKFSQKALVNVRAWDRNANDGKGGFSTTELREQKVYTCEWVG
jgi:hypothetical protein